MFHEYILNLLQLEIHLLPEFPPDVAEPFDTIEAHCLEASVTKHLGYLGVSIKNSCVTLECSLW